MTEIIPGDIVEFSGDRNGINRLVTEGVGVYVGPTAGIEWFHDGESLGSTGSAVASSLVRRIGHDDDVNYARTVAATRSGRGSGFRSEGITGDECALTPEEAPEAARSAPVDSRGVVYVSGPMTGYEGYNFPAFDDAADLLRASGWEVRNPADKGVIDGWTWEDYLRYDLREISECDAIYTLPGWRESRGSRLEMHVAEELGIEWLNPDGLAEAKRRFMEAVKRNPGLDPDELSERTVEAIGRLEGRVIRDSAGGIITRLTDEVRTVSESGGEKGVKPARFDLIPAGPLWQVAEHYGKGAEKYEDRNWERGYEWSKSFQALQRHAWSFWRGETFDPETGSHHMAAVIFHALALIEFHGTHPEYDDRPGEGFA